MLTLSMSAFGGKADIADLALRCPLMTQSGHPTDPGWSLAVLLVMRTFLYTIHPSSRLVVGELPGPFEELCLGHWDVAIILRR